MTATSVDSTRTPPTNNTTTAIVEARGVHRSFGDTVAVAGLDLDVPPGSVTVLLGPNGAGKTTVVRLLTGALPTDVGSIRVFGLDPTGSDGAAVRRRCGVVPARPALYDRLSGWDNLRYSGELFEVEPAALPERIRDAAQRFDIEDALAKQVGGYSTGMRARLALARAVLHDPDLLLLDEPTAGLDPESAKAVLGLIDEIAAQGKAVLMCTHLLLEAEGLADQVIVLDRGRTLVCGSPDELSERFWPRARVLIDAEDPGSLDRMRSLEFVRRYERNGVATVELDREESIPDLVEALVANGVRLRRVEPQNPTLEQLYFAIRTGQTSNQP
ncbi:MAG: ABC transporter ATP-binding protein [Actinobacteria bacterium]|nr:MAG: ABC transporter ATP-binding protein [Actinomycetota bacterium]